MKINVSQVVKVSVLSGLATLFMSLVLFWLGIDVVYSGLGGFLVIWYYVFKELRLNIKNRAFSLPEQKHKGWFFAVKVVLFLWLLIQAGKILAIQLGIPGSIGWLAGIFVFIAYYYHSFRKILTGRVS